MATHDYRDDPDYSDPYWGEARYEHAYFLRREGLTYRSVGYRLGVGAERARQMVAKHQRLQRPREVDRAGKNPQQQHQVDVAAGKVEKAPHKAVAHRSVPVPSAPSLPSLEQLQLKLRCEEMAAYDQLPPLTRQALREVTLAISARAALEYYYESGCSDFNTADMVHAMD